MPTGVLDDVVALVALAWGTVCSKKGAKGVTFAY